MEILMSPYPTHTAYLFSFIIVQHPVLHPTECVHVSKVVSKLHIIHNYTCTDQEQIRNDTYTPKGEAH